MLSNNCDTFVLSRETKNKVNCSHNNVRYSGAKSISHLKICEIKFLSRLKIRKETNYHCQPVVEDGSGMFKSFIKMSEDQHITFISL